VYNKWMFFLALMYMYIGCYII